MPRGTARPLLPVLCHGALYHRPKLLPTAGASWVMPPLPLALKSNAPYVPRCVLDTKNEDACRQFAKINKLAWQAAVLSELRQNDAEKSLATWHDRRPDRALFYSHSFFPRKIPTHLVPCSFFKAKKAHPTRASLLLLVKVALDQYYYIIE